MLHLNKAEEHTKPRKQSTTKNTQKQNLYISYKKKQANTSFTLRIQIATLNQIDFKNENSIN